MKALKFFLPALFLFAVIGMSATATPPCGDEAKASVTKVKVSKIVNNEKAAKKLTADMMKMDGVTNVEANTETGIVAVSFDKAKINCCSKVHTAMKTSGWDYEAVAAKDGGKACCAKAASDGGCAKKSASKPSCHSEEKAS